MPLNPAEPVNPVEEPSVNMVCDSDPKTRMAPASPAIEPDRARAVMIERRTGIPA